MTLKNKHIEKLYRWKMAIGKNDPLKQTIRSVSEWRDDINGIVDTLQSPFASSEMEIQKLRRVWEDIVGPVLGNHTDPSSLKGNALIVTVENSVYAQELSFYNSSILSQLKKQGFKKISKIRSETGKIDRKIKNSGSGSDLQISDNKQETEVDYPGYITEFLDILEDMKKEK